MNFKLAIPLSLRFRAQLVALILSKHIQSLLPVDNEKYAKYEYSWKRTGTVQCILTLRNYLYVCFEQYEATVRQNLPPSALLQFLSLPHADIHTCFCSMRFPVPLLHLMHEQCHWHICSVSLL